MTVRCISRRAAVLGLVAVLGGALTACRSAAAPSGDPPAGPDPAAGTSPPELTAEQDLALHPPAPTGVRVGAARRGHVELTWAPPPPVTSPHTYGDRVVGYRIYRQGAGEVEPRPVGRSASTDWIDRTATDPGRYAYVVASVRDHEVEGTRSDPPAVAELR